VLYHVLLVLTATIFMVNEDYN